MCCHETVRRENTHLSQFSLGDSGFVFIAKGNTAAGANVVPDRYHVELKQLQRISEEAIRCLLCVR